jgi:hypothetical protein
MPLPDNPAALRCYQAYKSVLASARSSGVSRHHAHKAAVRAYRNAMPFIPAASMQDYKACVTFALTRRIIDHDLYCILLRTARLTAQTLPAKPRGRPRKNTVDKLPEK